MEFTEFYYQLVDRLGRYNAKYIDNKYSVPLGLYDNIDNRSEFMKLLHKLTENKLSIKCLKKLSKETIYYDYIIPTAVFLHYMHVDIDNLKQIDLFIVNRQTYEQYSPRTGGEYIEGKNPSEHHKVHIILVKQFNNNDTFNKEATLTSLFHELTHLVDNLDFLGFNTDLDYYLRCHEIKARVISSVFLEFYKRLLNDTNYLDNTLWLVKRSLTNIADDLMHEIDLNYYCIDEGFDERYILNDDIDNTEILKENIQFLTSMREVNTLQNFLIELGELII